MGNDMIAKIHPLQGWGLLAVDKICDQGHVMHLERRKSIYCFRWQCHTHRCRQTLGVRKGTIFEDFRSDIGRLASAIYFW